MAKHIEERFQDYVKKHSLFDRDKPLIVGLSGGKDSMALAHLLHKLNYPVVAAHCNFHLRAEDADLDQQLVEQWCQQNNIACKVKHFQTKAFALQEQVSIEMAARTLRYSWFRELLTMLSAGAIAVGHHLDDQVETFLMNITRGTGFRGLSAMKVENNKVVRPLLFASREEISQYVDNQNISFRDDHTNNDVTIKRNYFRHEIIPAFETVNPSFKRTIESNIERFLSIAQYFDALFAEMEKELVKINEDGFTIKIPDRKTRHVFPDFVHFILEKKGIASSLQPILDLLEAQVGSVAQIGTFKLIKDREALVFLHPRESEVLPVYVEKLPAEVTFGQYIFRFTGLEATELDKMPKENQKVWVSSNQIEWPIVIRAWQPGDRMKPLGMKQTRKIKKMLTDAKISTAQRHGFPVVTDKENVIWLPYVRPSQDYAVGHSTNEVVQIEVSLT